MIRKVFVLVVSMFVGGGLGLFMGLFLGALENPITQDQMTGRQQFIIQLNKWVLEVGVPPKIFSAAECIIERAGTKHDMTNTVVAGCVTGGTILARAGPQAACVGCAGFASFSAIIEKILENHE